MRLKDNLRRTRVFHNGALHLRVNEPGMHLLELRTARAGRFLIGRYPMGWVGGLPTPTAGGPPLMEGKIANFARGFILLVAVELFLVEGLCRD